MHHMEDPSPLRNFMGYFYGSPKWLCPDSRETSASSTSRYLYHENPKSIMQCSNWDSILNYFPHCEDDAESNKKHMVIEKTHGQSGSEDIKIEITISYNK